VGKADYDSDKYHKRDEYKLSAPRGFMFMMVPELVNGKPNVTTLLRNEQRRLDFDAISRTVLFKTTTTSGIVERTAPLKRTKTEAHLVLICWGPSDGLLFVDSSKSEMEASKSKIDKAMR
jgi:hypothetical protein